MSKWLVLAETADNNLDTPPDSLTKPDKTPSVQPEDALCQVLSKSQKVARSKTDAENADDMRHGFGTNGQPKTWTGNIVKLDDWRGLTEWQKHGPNGRMWCGACGAWLVDCDHIRDALGRGRK